MSDEMETQLMRWPLRLLLQGLDARDEGAVHRCLAHATRQLQHPWQVVHDGDAEVVLVAGLEIDTVGLILMIVGIIGLVISLAVIFMASDDRPRRPDDYPTRRL